MRVDGTSTFLASFCIYLQIQIVVDLNSMCTHTMCMNITLSADPELLRRARAEAKRRGMSLNEMVRALLESVVDEPAHVKAATMLEQLWADGTQGRSDGGRMKREDIYADNARLR